MAKTGAEAWRRPWENLPGVAVWSNRKRYGLHRLFASHKGRLPADLLPPRNAIKLAPHDLVRTDLPSHGCRTTIAWAKRAFSPLTHGSNCSRGKSSKCFPSVLSIPASEHSCRRFFSRAGGERWIVRSQYPVHLNDGSEPQPDLALVRTPGRFLPPPSSGACGYFLARRGRGQLRAL